MTSPFVSQVRTGGDVLRLADPGTPAITVRVEIPEVWDTVRAVVSPDDSVIHLKVRTLAALMPEGVPPEEFVMKFRGWEVLDEDVSLSAAGAVDGSIFLLTYRRRRPVR